MHTILVTLSLLLGLSYSLAWSAPDPILDTAERYARSQAQGLPGEVVVRVGQLDPNTKMSSCSTLQGFTPSGAHVWGKTHIGVRCLAPNQWTLLVPVQISVISSYVVTARPLAAGQVVQSGDLSQLRGDLAELPGNIVTDPAIAYGKTLKNSLAAGQPLRNDLLQAPLLIKQGQSVKIVSRGPGFLVTGEGKALSNASAGQIVQIRVPSGQTISGIVQDDASVEIQR